jgi:hypothetical protein
MYVNLFGPKTGFDLTREDCGKDCPLSGFGGKKGGGMDAGMPGKGVETLIIRPGNQTGIEMPREVEEFKIPGFGFDIVIDDDPLKINTPPTKMPEKEVGVHFGQRLNIKA